jgi:membrane protease YdiL (CAAX protease family)
VVTSSGAAQPVKQHRQGALAFGVLAVWFALEIYLPRVGRHFAPLWLQRLISLQTFLMLCQIVTAACGVVLCWLLLTRGRELLAWRPPSWRAAAGAVLVAPLLFAVTALLALRIALPTLLRELATHGAGATRHDAGAFGRMLQHAPVLATLVWSVLLAALTEELLFRGLFWSLCERAFGLVGRHGRRWEELAAESDRVPRPSSLRSPAAWGATLVVAVVFGWMHHDLPGGVGVVRTVSALCLGLACGIARQWSGSVVVAMLLHFSNNLMGLGQTRHWFATPLGALSGVPWILFIVGGAGALAAVILGVMRARRA